MPERLACRPSLHFLRHCCQWCRIRQQPAFLIEPTKKRVVPANAVSLFVVTKCAERRKDQPAGNDEFRHALSERHSFARFVENNFPVVAANAGAFYIVVSQQK